MIVLNCFIEINYLAKAPVKQVEIVTNQKTVQNKVRHKQANEKERAGCCRNPPAPKKDGVKQEIPYNEEARLGQVPLPQMSVGRNADSWSAPHSAAADRFPASLAEVFPPKYQKCCSGSISSEFSTIFTDPSPLILLIGCLKHNCRKSKVGSYKGN